MIRAMVSGTLHDDPRQGASQNGAPFTACKVKTTDRNGAWIWVSAIAFGEEAERLLDLKAGDTVTLSGTLTVEGWLRDDKPRVNIRILADQVTALKARKRMPLKPSPRPYSARYETG